MIIKPGTSTATLRLTLLSEPVALCRMAPRDDPPAWTRAARQFLTISRTATELSIVADERVVPASVDAQRGYRVLRVEGPLPLDLVGIFASLASPLADASVPIFPIATFDTDYLLVREPSLERALSTLRGVGHVISVEARDAG